MLFRVCAFLSCLSVAAAVNPLVDLGYTKYLGLAIPAGITQWLGIRYAAPPVGNLRFRAPADPVVNNTVQIANQVSHRVRTVSFI